MGGGSFVGFADFCRLQAHYDRVVGARKRRLLRQRARRMSLEEGALEAAGVAATAGAADKAVLTTSTATGAAAASGGPGASGL